MDGLSGLDGSYSGDWEVGNRVKIWLLAVEPGSTKFPTIPHRKSVFEQVEGKFVALVVVLVVLVVHV